MDQVVVCILSNTAEHSATIFRHGVLVGNLDKIVGEFNLNRPTSSIAIDALPAICISWLCVSKRNSETNELQRHFL
jgi:hypothetical protein